MGIDGLAYKRRYGYRRARFETPMNTAVVAIIAAAIGLPIGSFLNVVIWRVPRNASVVRPPSHCPGCDQPIKPYDNIPVVSWILLRGKCRRCSTRISGRYPFIEAATAASFAAIGARFGQSIVVVPLLVLTAALIALCAIDIEHLLLPNRVVYPTGFMVVPLFALSAAVDDQWNAFGRAALGGLVAFAVFYAIWFAAPKAMGFGDVRLSFILGFAAAYFGWSTLGYALFLPFLLGSVGGIAIAAPIVLIPMTVGGALGYASGRAVMRSYQGVEPVDVTQARLVVATVFAVMLGSLVYLVLAAMKRVERGRHIPFGPYLAAGAIIAICI